MATAQLANSQLADLSTLAQRVKAILETSGLCSQGAVLRLDRQRAILSSWGLTKRALSRLLPTRALNGAGAVRLPEGWRSVEIGSPTVPGLLAVKLADDQSDELLLVLGAQIAAAWGSLVAHEEFVRREQAVTTLTQTLQDLAHNLNVDDFLQTVVDQATELLGASGGGVYLLEPSTQDLVLRHIARFPSQFRGVKIPVGRGVVGTVARDGEAALVNDYELAEQRIESLPEGVRFSAVIAAPLRDDDVIGGVIALAQIEAGRTFTKADLALLESFAAQASLALRTARLFDAQRRQARELYVLYENSRTVGSSLDLRHILERLTENALLALNVEQSTVLLWDESRKLFELVALALDEGLENPAADLRLGATFELGQASVPSMVFETGQPVVVADPARDQRFSARRNWFLEQGIRSTMGIPLTILDHVIGVLICSTFTAPRAFNPSEITLAQTLASQAATAIGNSRLLSDERRRSTELTLLQELSTKLNAGIGLSAALEAIGEGVRQLLPNIDLEICLYDPQTEALNSHYATELTRTHYVSETGVYHLDQGLTGWLARHRTTLRIGDMRQQRTVRPMRADVKREFQFRSYLGLPLLVGDELIGTLELGAAEANRFDAEDERLLKIIASQAGQALRNVRRYEATDEVLRERVRELLALQRISRELTSTLQLEQLLPAMLNEIVQATGCNHGMVILSEDEGQPFRVVAQLGYPDELALDPIVEGLIQNGSFAESLERAEAVIIDDLTALDSPVDWLDVRSVLLAPILYENRVAGAIIASGVKSHSFNHTALDFVRAVADQAALAIGNAQHYAEQVRQRELLQQRASLLNEVLEIGNALRADMDLNSLLEQIAFSVTEAAGFRLVEFSLLDADNPSQLRTVSGAGLALADLESRRTTPVPISAIDPYLDPQYRVGRAYYVPANRQADGETWEDGDRLLVPLYSTERELIGVMTVDDPFARERPTRRVVETLEIFANQAAIAVENARLFSQRSRQIAELGVINRISQAASSSLDFEALAAQVYDVLRQALPIDSYYMMVLNHAADSVIASWTIDHGTPTSNPVTGPINPTSLAGWIVRNSEPLLFTNMPEQARNYQGINWVPWGEGDQVPRSWIGMPLLLGDGTIRGVLSIQNVKEGRYSDRDVALLRTVANQLAVAVENARLYGDAQRRLQELALVNHIGSLTNSALNLVDILKEVYQSLRTVLPIDAFYSFVYDPVRGEVVQRVNVDEGTFYIESHRERLLPQSPSRWIIENLQPLLFHDMPSEMEGRFQVKRFGNPNKWVRSWIGVPLKISDDTPVGLISVQHYQIGVYSEREVSLLQTVASQVALAVQNARLFSERERQIRELDAISQIGQLMSSSLDLQEMLGQTAFHLQQVTGAPVFYTMVYDPERDSITSGYAIQEGVVAGRTPRGKPRPGSPSEWVLRQRQPLILNDVTDAKELDKYGVRPMANPIEGKERSPRSWVGVPILAKDGAPIGMLSLQDYAVNAFDERTVSFLTNVVSHASLGIQKVQLFNERDRQIKELEAIRRVGQVTSSTLDATELMEGVYGVLTDFLPVESFVINIYDPERDMLVYNLLIDRGNRLPVPMVRPVKPRSLTDWILRNRKPLLFRNLNQELADYADIEPLQHGEGPSAQSWMGVPLMASNEQPVGMLALQHYDTDMFDERDLDFLGNVAYQVTLGIQNVRLHEQTQTGLVQLGAEAERLALINHVSNLTASTLDSQVLYNLAVEEMARATGADQARLLLFDYENETGITRAEYPQGDLSIQVPIKDNATIPWLQEHRRPLVINDPANDPLAESFRSTLLELGIKRLLLVPLIVKGDMIGSVGLDSIQGDKEFTQRDAETCQTIANQVSQALENVRLFVETERQANALSRKVGELSVLLEAGQALSSIREPALVLDTLVRLVARQLHVDTVILCTLATDDALVPQASLGLPDEFVKSMRVRIGEGMIGTVAANGQPLAITDVQHSVDEPQSRYPDFNQNYGLVSFLGVPVLYRDEVTGVLSVMTNTRTEFTADDIALLSALADQAAIALENTRLFAERERQITVLQALNDVTQAITSTLDPQTLLRQLHARLGLVVDTRYSFIALYDNEHNTLSFPVVVNEGRATLQNPLPLAEGVLSRVVRTRRTIVLSSLEETKEASRVILGDDQPMASWVGVPIMLGELVLGVINIQSHLPRAFSADTVQFLQAVASQTAIALENARLFAERERQVAEAAILSSISQSMTATLTPEELASSIMRGLEPVFDMDNAYIILYDAPSNMISTTIGSNQGEAFTGPPVLLTNEFLKTMLFVQQPLIFNNREEQREQKVTPQLDHLPDGQQLIAAESVIAAAITMGSQTSGMMINQPLGVLVVQSTQPNAFTRTQLAFLELVANQSSSAVQKAMLFNERERRIRELDTLNRISQAVTATIGLDEILQRLHEGLGEIIDMSTSYIGLYDEKTDMMQYKQTYDRGVPINFNPIRLGMGTPRWVIEHRQPLLLNTHEEADEYRDVATRESSRRTRVGASDKIEESYLIVPIVVGPAVIGVINIQSYDQYAFSGYDMSFVMTVAAQAGAAIANARAFAARERSIQQLRTLSGIGQALGSTVRFEDLLRVIYEQTSLLVDTKNLYLALYDERHHEVTFPLFYEHGEAHRIDPQRGLNGLTEYIIRTRRPLLLQGVDIPERMDELGVERIGDLALSWLGIPLIAADKVIGVMGIQSYDTDHAYTDDDVQLLSTVANQAAQALENARLFTESRESVRELSTLSETSVSLASTLDIDELLAISASSAIEMSRADFGGVIVMSGDGATISNSLVLNRDHMELTLPHEVAVNSMYGLRNLRNGQVVSINDAAKDESLVSLTEPLGIRGVVFLPMMREGLRGVVFVGMDEPFSFEDRSIASLHILTTQISQAVNNAQLFEQIRHFNLELEEIVDTRTQELKSEKERVEALYNIATELGTTLDRDELLVRTLDMAATALNVTRGSVLLLDRESKQLICHAVLNDELGLRSLETPVVFERGSGLANWVISNNEGVVIEDVRYDERWSQSETGRGDDVRSVIAVPLLSSDAPQGVLMLNSTQASYFTGDHLRFLSTIGGEVSSALHNADLYTLVYESADRLSDAMWQQREEASKTSAILQSVSEGVMVLDHETERIILYNPAAAEVLRIPRAEVIDRSLSSVAAPRNEVELHEEGRALLLYTGLHEGIQQVHLTEAVHSSIIELPGQMIAANFASVTGEDGSRFGVVVVLRDITREIEADRAKRDFIATVSHELRTPLTPIRGFVDLLLLGAVGPLSDSQRETLNTVKSNTMRMVSLVEDLLEIGRLEAGKIVLNAVPSNINQLVRDTVTMWTLELEKKDMTLSLELDDTLPLIEYDTKRIGQVFTNLVSNAIKYTLKEGTVTIRTFLNKDGLAQLDVKDTGIGLKPEHIQNLFKRFYRADTPLREEVGGTGLGLSIAKSFVELHHGDMWVDSIYGEGSTFSISLPVQQPRPDLGEREDMGQALGSVQPIEETTA